MRLSPGRDLFIAPLYEKGATTRAVHLPNGAGASSHIIVDYDVRRRASLAALLSA